jgi:hypothetical protein
VLGEHVEIPVVIEDAGVVQLELPLLPGAVGVLPPQLLVGELDLGVLVERLAISVSGRGVEVVIQLLDVLAVVALRVGQAEEPLLEDGILAVPQRDGEAKTALPVGDT